MFRLVSLFGAVAWALSLVGCSAPPPEAGPDYWAGPADAGSKPGPGVQSHWQVVYVDDFDGPSGSRPSSAAWNERVVAAPYNAEKQYYTDRPSNIMLDGAGNLLITAQREFFVNAAGVASAQPYTSGRLDTQGFVQPKYGRIEARIKVPAGKGLWPAFWLLGSNIDVVSWPKCGEVDIMELGGSNPSVVTGSVHGPGYEDGSTTHDSYTLPAGSFADAFHVFALEWTAQGMRWLIDENPYAWRTPSGMANLHLPWIFDQPMFILLNLAVGGIYDGDPDAATPLPAHMAVDYVKVSALVAN